MTTSSRKVFWAVKYGDIIRLSYDKFYNAKDACKQTFGLICERMYVKNLGGRVDKLQNQKWYQGMLKSKEGWHQMQTGGRVL